MAITLDGIALPDLLISNRYGDTQVATVFEESLGGYPLVWEYSKKYKIIDLVGTDSTAWITKALLSSLYALAASPNTVYVLVYEGVTTNVRFRNESPPAIYADPLIGRPNSADGDYYTNVRLKLMEVS